MMLLGYVVAICTIYALIRCTSGYSKSDGRLVISFLHFGIGRLNKERCQNVVEQWENIGYKLYKTKNYVFAFYAPWSKF